MYVRNADLLTIWVPMRGTKIDTGQDYDLARSVLVCSPC